MRISAAVSAQRASARHTDGLAKCVSALVYYVGLENEECRIAYPNLLFDRSIIGGHGAMCSVLAPTVGNNQGMGGVEVD